MIGDYIKKIGFRRMIIMLIGNALIGVGISIFKLSGLGNDPYSGMVMALAEQINISYANLLLIMNGLLFVVQLIFGRYLIGLGTLVNACFIGYVVQYFYQLWLTLLGVPGALWLQVIIVCIGVIVCSLGVSLYQTTDMGVAPYDSTSLMMAKTWKKIPYQWHRIATDSFCAVACWLAGGIVGLGTIVSAFGFGPVIHFFNVHVSRKLLKK